MAGEEEEEEEEEEVVQGEAEVRRGRCYPLTPGVSLCAGAGGSPFLSHNGP